MQLRKYNRGLYGVIGLVLLFALGLSSITSIDAQPAGMMTPPQAGEAIRQALFDAQAALMGGKTDEAVAAVNDAQAIYSRNIRWQFFGTLNDLTRRMDTEFSAALTAAQAGDSLAFAAHRSLIWTGLVEGSCSVVFAAIGANDGEKAALWLPLRDFRPSTKFSRPGADATIAINNFITFTTVTVPDFSITPLPNSESGSSAVSTPIDSTPLTSEYTCGIGNINVITPVRTDLFDTYQARMNIALKNTDEANQQNFKMRRAEEAGLAAGYFNVIALEYSTQRGDTALQSLKTAFQTLVDAAISDDTSTFAQARAEIDAALIGFRAAPLSQQELSRRAQQILQFITLVPIEYTRGVRDGVVTNQIEIQEALTFHEGAAAAFADLETDLLNRDAAAAQKVKLLLDLALSQIQRTADPTEVRSTIDEVKTLLTGLFPPEWLTNTDASMANLDVIVSLLDQVENAAAQNNYTQAETTRLEAYTLLELGVEQRLAGFAPEIKTRIENLFWQGSEEMPGLAVLLAEKSPIDDIRVTLAELKSVIGEAYALLNNTEGAVGAVVGNSAIIVFREGLEAVLILASLIASLRAADQRRYRRPLIAGAALAFGATVVTWWIATSLLNVLLPFGESLEAIVSLISIGVLLLITNWFFHKSYWTGWLASFHSRKKQLIQSSETELTASGEGNGTNNGGILNGSIGAFTVGQVIGLVLLGFTSIYREGFETVLFLQALVLDAGVTAVLEGVALGLMGVLVVGIITFALEVRLPYKKLLIVTGIMIGVVLVNMVGTTVHVMQALGWIPITPISGLFFPTWMEQWLGFYATWQGIVLQVVAAAFVIGSYFLAEHQQKRKRDQMLSKSNGKRNGQSNGHSEQPQTHTSS